VRVVCCRDGLRGFVGEGAHAAGAHIREWGEGSEGMFGDAVFPEPLRHDFGAPPVRERILKQTEQARAPEAIPLVEAFSQGEIQGREVVARREKSRVEFERDALV
jgi:hypothetical protein